jgi:hypothetical protein
LAGYRNSIAVGQQADAIFRGWAKQKNLEQLNESNQLLKLAGSGQYLERDILRMRKWVREALRKQFRVYIQRYQPAAVDECGGTTSKRRKAGLNRARSESVEHAVMVDGKCEYPCCGRVFEKGMYRVSFEPRAWTTLVQNPGVREGVEEKMVQRSSQLLAEMPNYAVLIAEHERIKNDDTANDEIGRFFCILCFEDLLKLEDTDAANDSSHESKVRGTPLGVPITREQKVPRSKQNNSSTNRILLSSKKRTRRTQKLHQDHITPQWIRPNAITRIYSAVFPETRYSSSTRLQLDDAAAGMVEGWKVAQCRSGKRQMMEKYEFLAGMDLDTDFEMDIENDKEMARFPAITREDGVGLAECLCSLTLAA